MKYLFFKASTPPFALTVKVTFPQARSRYPERRERSSREEREREREERELSPSRSRVTLDAAVFAHSMSRSRTPERRERSNRGEKAVKFIVRAGDKEGDHKGPR